MPWHFLYLLPEPRHQVIAANFRGFGLLLSGAGKLAILFFSVLKQQLKEFEPLVQLLVTIQIHLAIKLVILTI